MTEQANAGHAPAPVEEVQHGWQDLKLRVGQLETERALLQDEIKTLRSLLERVIDHRQKSHGELVILLTNLVSKLSLNDVGVIVSKLVEHNTNVSHTLAALLKGTAEADMPQPLLLKNLEQTKQDLLAAIKPLVDELLQLDTAFETDLLQALATDPELFFSPKVLRANRCFVKGQVPRERIVRDFGDQALVFFNDMTTDPKLNPHPKPDEILLGFKNDFEALLQLNPNLLPQKGPELLALHQKIQRSKAATDQARAQKNAFQKLSFLIELLHYYEHQNTIAPDVVFALRLPALLEQLVLAGPQDNLEEKWLLQAESLLAYVLNPDHRQAIINNLGKGGGTGKTLKFVLKLRTDKVPELDQVLTDFLKHLVPARPQPSPTPEALAAVLRLLHPDMQRAMIKALMNTDRLRRDEAEALAKAVAEQMGLKGLEEQIKAQQAPTPEAERQAAWNKIKDLIVQRTEPATIAAAIRDRLNTKYDADEMKQSWVTLTESDPLSLIKIFCHVPYRSDGKTDPIARPLLETYVTRLTHEKYAGTYKKVVNSLRSMHSVRPDTPMLLNFLALVRWVDPESANRLSADIGIPVAA